MKKLYLHSSRRKVSCIQFVVRIKHLLETRKEVDASFKSKGTISVREGEVEKPVPVKRPSNRSLPPVVMDEPTYKSNTVLNNAKVESSVVGRYSQGPEIPVYTASTRQSNTYTKQLVDDYYASLLKNRGNSQIAKPIQTVQSLYKAKPRICKLKYCCYSNSIMISHCRERIPYARACEDSTTDV